MKLSYLIYLFFQITFWLIILRIFLTWVRTVDWYKQPFVFLRTYSDLFLTPFQRLIPSINGLDFSPIIALFVLQFAVNVIVSKLASMGY